MSNRTPQQALKDAIDSGAVAAWINGEEIEYRVYGSADKWTPVESPWSDFALHGLEYRAKPPEPTRINWRPVVTGREPKGTVLGTWEATVQSCYYKGGKWYRTVDGISVSTPRLWAPMCSLPEED